MARVKLGIMKNCLICLKLFYVQKCDLEIAKYCSRACKAIADTKQFCIRGHEIAIVGRTKAGICKACKEILRKKSQEAIKNGYKPRQLVQFCPNGHDTFICGRYSSSVCKQCILDYQKEFRIEHKEEKAATDKKYRETHREELALKELEYYRKNRALIDAKKKIYIAEHPEIYKLIHLRQKEKRGKRVVKFGREGMREFYKNMPKGMTEDHIIPLCGDLVSGLHVIWNLQYLSPKDNLDKSNDVDLNWASEFYGKILEEAGLK